MLRRWPLLALFYFSGLAGLIYQVLWLRRLSLVFGVTVYAASAVLAASIFHFGTFTIGQAKRYLSDHGIPMGMD